MEAKETHHRLRLGMTGVLALLLTTGLSFQYLNAQALERADRPSPSISPTTPTPSASTPRRVSLASKDQQVLDRIKSAQVRAGCNLDMLATEVAASLGTCNILIVGDSIGNNLSVGIKSQLGGTKGVIINSRSKSSTGLSNSWFYNWPKEFKKMLNQYKPNLVIVMLGANDHQNMKIGSKVVSFGSAAWNAKYASYMREMTGMATAAGAYLTWVGLPVMRPASYAKAMTQLNAIYEDVATHETGVSFVKTKDYFSDSRGKFRAWANINGKRSKIRGDDGIHFASAGQPVLGTFVIDQLKTIFHVKISAKAPKRITG